MIDSLLLATSAVFFPLWLGLYQQGPLTEKDTEYQQQTVVDPAYFDILREVMPIADQRFRAECHVRLASKPIRANQNFLLECLSKENDQRLKASILSLLPNTGIETIPPEAIAPYISDKSILVSRSAIALYGTLPKADPRLLAPFLGAPQDDTTPIALKKQAWLAFANSPRLANTLGSNVLKFKNADLDFQCLALQAALAQDKRLPQTSQWLKEAARGNIRLRLVAARDTKPEAAVLSLLLKDEKPSIRLAACRANKGTHRELITAALEDKDPSVRQAALTALTRFTSPATLEILGKVALRFGDKSPLVRNEAELTFANLGTKVPNAPSRLAPLLKTAIPPEARFHAIKAMTALQSKDLLPEAVALLSQEKKPEIIAATLDAIAMLAAKNTYADTVVPLAEHPSALVRQATAKALGRLAIPGTEPVLKKLANISQKPNVRIEAFEAMGHFPQMTFTDDILACLNNTRNTLSAERANAAWASAQMRPGTDEDTLKLITVARRLVTQVTVAVVPTDMEPMFEETFVLCNCILGLASMAKNTGNEELNEIASSILFLYDIEESKIPPPTPNSSQSSNLPRSAVTWSVAHQARQWLAGETPTAQNTPQNGILFPAYKNK